MCGSAQVARVIETTLDHYGRATALMSRVFSTQVTRSDIRDAPSIKKHQEIVYLENKCNMCQPL